MATQLLRMIAMILLFSPAATPFVIRWRQKVRMFSRYRWIRPPTWRIGVSPDLFTHASHRFTNRMAQPKFSRSTSGMNRGVSPAGLLGPAEVKVSMSYNHLEHYGQAQKGASVTYPLRKGEVVCEGEDLRSPPDGTPRRKLD